MGTNEPVAIYAKSIKNGLRFIPNPIAAELPSAPPTENPALSGKLLENLAGLAR